MKKCWFCLTTLLLLLIPCVALAGNEIVFHCFSCNAERTGIKSDTYEYFSQDVHIQRIICKVCNNKGMSIRSAHTETKAATCQSPAYCADCKSYYGSKAEHNWGEWTTDAFYHKRTCQTSNCGAVDEGSHTSEPRATCKTAQTCGICNVQYKDMENHEGEVKTRYGYHSESEHKLESYCSGCGDVVSTVYEAHTESYQATCQAAAYCADCKSYYGSPNPDAHNWNEWQSKKSNPKLHYHYCWNFGCSASESEPHVGNSNCVTSATCSKCHATYKDTTKHAGPLTYTYEKIDESFHKRIETCTACGKKTGNQDSAQHEESIPADCAHAAWCNACNQAYGDPNPDNHDLVQHDAQAPTCTEIGWNAYEACKNCAYTTYEELTMLVHWYGEWMPNADDTHTASCLRNCQYARTVPCTFFAYQLKSADQAAEVTLCPVCGEVSDGTRLMLAEAAAKAVTGKLPAGEIVVRMGTLESGEVLMSVAFEISGKMTQPTGQVKITLPAELLEGYTLSLLAEDGTETELTDVQDGSFVLDFSGASSPVRVIRLVPQAA